MKSKPQALNTQHLQLGPIRECDADDMIRIFLNEEVCKTYMLPQFQSQEKASKLFHRLWELSQDPDRVIYGIYQRDRLIGFLNDVNTDGDTIEMGYVIHPDHKNNGYATEAFSAVIQALFSMGYTAVKAGAFQENTASIRVMEKCGMMRTHLEEDIDYRGQCHHCIYYAITGKP